MTVDGDIKGALRLAIAELTRVLRGDDADLTIQAASVLFAYAAELDRILTGAPVVTTKDP